MRSHFLQTMLKRRINNKASLHDLPCSDFQRKFNQLIKFASKYNFVADFGEKIPREDKSQGDTTKENNGAKDADEEQDLKPTCADLCAKLVPRNEDNHDS